MDGRGGNDGNEGGSGKRKEGLFGRGDEQSGNAYGSEDERDLAYGRTPQQSDPNRRSSYERYPDDPNRQGEDRPSGAHTPSGLSPWVGVWTRPRQVTRDFIHSADPLRNALWLALIAGFLNALNTASSRNLGDQTGPAGILVGTMISGVIGGLLTYYVGSWLLKLVGGWLGGVGTTNDMRVVSGRIAGMLSIMVGLFWIPELLIAGMENFTYATPNLDESAIRSLLYLGFILLEFVFGIWSFVLILHAVGAAHRFSAWKSLLSFVILGAALFVIVAVIAVVVALSVGATFGL